MDRDSKILHAFILFVERVAAQDIFLLLMRDDEGASPGHFHQSMQRASVGHFWRIIAMILLSMIILAADIQKESKIM